jgi:hypothetical protein
LDDPNVPMVCLASVGGPYDDEAFRAGMRLGSVLAVMKLDPAPETVECVVRCVEVDQVDLMAMTAGYYVAADRQVLIESEGQMDAPTHEWHRLTLYRASPIDAGLPSPPGGPIP